MITRHQMLKLSGGAAGTLILPACSANSLPLTASGIRELTQQPPGSPLGLATSLKQEYTYQAVVEGKIPQELRGTLYRNGPGLFERNGVRKRSLLDGDGMVQAYHIRNDNVEYRNRFTRTANFIEEEASGEFRYGGWTTQAPGGVFSNLFASGIKNQAGVSVVRKNNRLYAFDESIQPYELHPETLETVGLSHLGLPEDPAVYYAAHSKTDSKNGDWCHFGLQYGRNIDIYFTVFHASGKLKKKWIFESPRYVYLHDYFVTENYFILNLHPAKVNIFGFLFGLRSLTDSFEWQPEKGNMLVLLKRDGSGDPLILETETAWMWHSLNAYEKNGEIIADFVGYENPDHFIGDDPTFSAIMSGRSVVSKYNGEIRRYRIDIKNKRIQQTVLDQGSHEFPIVNPQHTCHTHRYGYFAAGHGKADASLFSQIKRLDFQSGKTAVYNFGEGYFCGEPVFAPKPDFRYNPESAEEPGWILTQVYDSHTHKNFLAVLDAEHLADGPLALIHHTHHLPFGLHGWWSGIS